MFIFAQEEPLLKHNDGLLIQHASNLIKLRNTIMTYIEHAIFSICNTAAFNFMKDNFRAQKKNTGP